MSTERPPPPPVPGVRRGTATPRAARATGTPRWRFAEVAGRLVELSSKPGPTAALTLSMALVRDAQRRGETAAWIGPLASLFFPPDAARAGIDLAAFPIVRVPEHRDVARTAERLVRSGAFGLVLLDLTTAGPRARVPPALLNRLAALAREHEAAVVCLSEKPDDAPSLGPLVSLRAAARRRATSPTQPSIPGASTGARCTTVLDVLRDRRRPGRWQDTLLCEAPEGVEALLPHPALS